MKNVNVHEEFGLFRGAHLLRMVRVCFGGPLELSGKISHLPKGIGSTHHIKERALPNRLLSHIRLLHGFINSIAFNCCLTLMIPILLFIS